MPASQITAPNWHEGVPWQVENELAPIVANGGRGSGLASMMMNVYGGQRENQQGDYNDYMHAVNALQQQNMQFNQQELGAHTATTLLTEAGKAPGVMAAARSSPWLAGYAPGDTTQIDQAAVDAANSKNNGEALSGIGRAGAAGFQFPTATLSSMLPNAPGVVQGENPIVTARRVAAAAQANSGGGVTISGPIDHPNAGNDETPAHYSMKLKGANGGPPTNDELLAASRRLGPAPLGGGIGATLPAGPKVTNIPPELAGPLPGAGSSQTNAAPQPAPAAPLTQQQASKLAFSALTSWSKSGDRTLTAQYQDVMRGATANGGGGVPQVHLLNGHAVVVGASGRPYAIQ